MGDWVKLGVAKHHGAVLGDAICLNSSLPCVIDVKWVNLAVVCQDAQITGGTRQKKSFTLCRVMLKVRRLYEKLIRNKNLKLNAQHTRICGDHFPDEERMYRTQLPSIFPWTAIPEKRRVIEKHEVPSTTKKFGKDLKHASFVMKMCLLKKSTTMSVTMRFLYLKILILWSVEIKLAKRKTSDI